MANQNFRLMWVQFYNRPWMAIFQSMFLLALVFETMDCFFCSACSVLAITIQNGFATPLHLSCIHCLTGPLDLLLEYGANVNAVDEYVSLYMVAMSALFPLCLTTSLLRVPPHLWQHAAQDSWKGWRSYWKRTRQSTWRINRLVEIFNLFFNCFFLNTSGIELLYLQAKT